MLNRYIALNIKKMITVCLSEEQFALIQYIMGKSEVQELIETEVYNETISSCWEDQLSMIKEDGGPFPAIDSLPPCP